MRECPLCGEPSLCEEHLEQNRSSGFEQRPSVKLTGTDGNVFSLIGLCNRACRKAGWSSTQVSEFTARCMKADSYDEVLRIMMTELECE